MGATVIPVGWLLDRVEARIVMISGAIAAGAAFLIASRSNSLAPAIVGRKRGDGHALVAAFVQVMRAIPVNSIWASDASAASRRITSCRQTCLRRARPPAMSALSRQPRQSFEPAQPVEVGITRILCFIQNGTYGRMQSSYSTCLANGNQMLSEVQNPCLMDNLERSSARTFQGRFGRPRKTESQNIAARLRVDNLERSSARAFQVDSVLCGRSKTC